MEQLNNRYREFLGIQTAQLSAYIHWMGPSGRPASLTPRISFLQDLLKFDSPGYQGYINIQTGKTELSLYSSYAEEDVDYFIRTIFAMLLFQKGGILLHSAGIVREQQAYMFFGHSGCGKTTVSRLSTNDLILNDDLVAVLPERGHWQAFGTPFWNPTQTRPTSHSAPLAGLYRLIQDKKVFKEAIPNALAMAELMANTPVINANPFYYQRLMDKLLSLVDSVPAYYLHFLPDDSFWQVIGSEEKMKPGI